MYETRVKSFVILDDHTRVSNYKKRINCFRHDAILPRKSSSKQIPKIVLTYRPLLLFSSQVYFGTTVARYYLAFHMFGLSCFTGMSYLIKKRELDELNGLSWFGRFLAEDFFIAKFLHKK